jgi:hypothetical protein
VVTTTAGSAFGGATYTAVDPSFTPLPNDIGFVVTLLPDFTGTGALELEFFASDTFATPTNLTNAGGTIFTGLNEFECLNASCTSVDDLDRSRTLWVRRSDPFGARPEDTIIGN